MLSEFPTTQGRGLALRRPINHTNASDNAPSTQRVITESRTESGTKSHIESPVHFYPLVLSQVGQISVVEYASRLVRVGSRTERWFILRDVPQWGASHVHNIALRGDAVRQIATLHDSPDGNNAWRLFILRPLHQTSSTLAEELNITSDLLRRFEQRSKRTSWFVRWRPSRHVDTDNALVDEVCAMRPLCVPEPLAVTLGRYFQVPNVVGFEGAARHAELPRRRPHDHEPSAMRDRHRS